MYIKILYSIKNIKLTLTNTEGGHPPEVTRGSKLDDEMNDAVSDDGDDACTVRV